MKRFDMQCNAFSVSTYVGEECPDTAAMVENGLVLVNMPGQSIRLDAADDVALFFGIKGKALAGKVYSVNEAIRQRPLIDFRSLLKRFNFNAEEAEVFISPSLTFTHLEEGDEVLARVIELGYGLACKGTSGKHYIDQQTLILLQMRALGVLPENIHISAYDNYDTPELKSASRGDEEKNRFVAVLLDEAL